MPDVTSGDVGKNSARTERLFLAVCLTESAREVLTERMRAVTGRTAKVRWVPRENLHITLKFFGETTTERRTIIEAAMERATTGIGSFDVLITGVKLVRRRRSLHMVWATVTDSDERLQRLHSRAERLLECSGYAREARAFSPHITLARVRDGIGSSEQRLLEAWAAQQRDEAAIHLQIREVTLMRSELSPQGAAYNVCKRFELQGT